MQIVQLLRTKEDIVFWVFALLLMISSSGLRDVRYAVYLMPMVAAIIWLGAGNYRLHLNRNNAPFLLLFALAVAVAYDLDLNWAKKTYFLFAYVSVFVLFDMSKMKLDVRVFNIVIIGLFFYTELVFGPDRKSLAGGVSLIESRALLESTFGFSLGLFAVYFLTQKKYFWFIFNVALSALAFKRIVLLALIMVVIAYLIPKRLKSLLLHPALLTVYIMITLAMFLEVAQGTFDDLISQYLGISANQLLMGRQDLWSLAMKLINFDYGDFTLFGVGYGGVTSALQSVYGGRDVLLHSDLLLVLFDNGIIATAVFVFLLLAQKTREEKYLAIYLCLILLTDNVLIYQHVMVPYLLLLGALRRDAVNVEVTTEESRAGNAVTAG